MRAKENEGPILALLDRYLVRNVSRLPKWGARRRFLQDAVRSGQQRQIVDGGPAAVMAIFPGRPRRAALHGLIAQGVASGVTNVVFNTCCHATGRTRNSLPVFRFVHPQPTSYSMPSGHSASAVAFAVGAGLCAASDRCGLGSRGCSGGLFQGAYGCALALRRGIRFSLRRCLCVGHPPLVAGPAAYPPR